MPRPREVGSDQRTGDQSGDASRTLVDRLSRPPRQRLRLPPSRDLALRRERRRQGRTSLPDQRQMVLSEVRSELRRGRRRVLVRRRLQRSRDRQRRDLRQEPDQRRPSDPAVAQPRPRDQSRERPVDGRPDQRPGALRRRPADRPLRGGSTPARLRAPGPGQGPRHLPGHRRRPGGAVRAGPAAKPRARASGATRAGRERPDRRRSSFRRSRRQHHPVCPSRLRGRPGP